MITFTAVDFFQVLDLENYDLDIFNMASTEGLDMESIGGFFKFVFTIVSDNISYAYSVHEWDCPGNNADSGPAAKKMD
jgi:hypothetical protein